MFKTLTIFLHKYLHYQTFLKKKQFKTFFILGGFENKMVLFVFWLLIVTGDKNI